MSGEAKAAIIAAIIGAVATLLCTFITVYQPLKSDTDTLARRVANLEKENARLTNENASLEDEISRIAKENAELREKLSLPPDISVTDGHGGKTNPPPSGATAISSASELYSYITADMSGSFYLTKDIDMTDEDWKDRWTPLGRKSDSKTVAFTGTLDGQGHAIRGVKNSGDSFGLFEVLSGTVQNLSVDVQFKSGNNVRGGALAVSMTEGGTIENCFVSGNMDFGHSSKVGSFVGTANKGSLLNCLSTLNMRFTTSSEVGGMIGEASGAAVTNCFFRSEQYEPHSPYFISVENCGGVIGKWSDCAINSCHYYYGNNSSEIPARLRQQVTYAGWDWNVWAISGDVNDGFPYLRTFEAQFQQE